MRAEQLCRNQHRELDDDNRPVSPCAACVQDAATYPTAPALRTETIDGILFEVSTWDPAPTPWNSGGYWVEDPEVTARCLESITSAMLARGFDPDQLVREALAAEPAPPGVHRDEMCRSYWGSHGCDLPFNHHGLCVCSADPEGGRPCSAILKWGPSNTAILWWGDDTVGLRLGTLRWTWFE